MDCQRLCAHKHTIEKTLQQDFIFLNFPEPLEQIYREHQCRQSSSNFRSRSLVVLFLYLVLCTGIIDLLPAGAFDHWLSIYGWVGLIIIAAGVLAHVPKMARYFEWYVGVGSLVAVALSFAVATIPYAGYSNILAHAGIMYATVIIYGFVGLRFYSACLAGWGGGLLGIVLTVLFNEHIDWQLFHRTYTGSSILGMCLAYVTDHQERAKFLQDCLLNMANAETEEKNEQLAALSREDALTGLANRRSLEEMLRAEWLRSYRQQSSLALIMIDVDYFKRYNDHFGHPAGDSCLQQLALLLKKHTSRSGDLAARYGGEEFLLVLPNFNRAEAVAYIACLHQAVAELGIVHPGSPVKPWLTLSAGISVGIPEASDGMEEFIKQADIALYQAKAQGRDGYVIYQDIKPEFAHQTSGLAHFMPVNSLKMVGVRPFRR